MRLAIVAAPKAFQGHTGIIQRNAIASWRALGRDIDILLGGDVAGLASVASEARAVRLGPIADGVDGPPRVDDLFAKARAATQADLIAYVNSDIMLMPDWLAAVRRVAHAFAGHALVIGRRTDLDLEELIDVADPLVRIDLLDRVRCQGRLAARVCKDYFVFHRDGYPHVPAFTLGRAYWDNWMVHDARVRGLPVVEITASATAVHQNHDYAHLSGGRLSAYLTSDGARENRRLAGGSRMITGAAATWCMRPSGAIERVPLSAMAAFAADLPRFVALTLAVAAAGVSQVARQATRRTGSVPRPRVFQASGEAPKMPSRKAA
ncbi:MAG: hypothetical protein WCR51_07300 [Planctomycetia bacterium]